MSMAVSGSGRFAALQYKAGRTPLHQLDARTKLLAMAIAIAGVLIAPHPIGYLALAALLVVASAVGRIGPRVFWRAFGPLLILFFIGGIITAIVIPGPIAYHLGPLHVTRTGVDLVVRASAQALVILYTSALVTMTTAPSALGNGLEWYMGPLRRLRIPVDDITVMVSLGLAFLPLLQQELQRILLAQRVRGADFRRGPIETRILNALALLPPLLAGNLRRAEELAVAMEARGYVPGARRTVLNAGHLGLADAVAVAVTLLCAIVAVRL
jgi:energy-coupling factor transport system permease protein